MKDTITPKEGEEVLLHLRKSIFVLKKQMFVFLLAVITSFVFLTFLFEYPVAAITAVIFLILALFYAFYFFLIWYFDVFTITNMRILIFAKKSLFYRHFSEVSYKEILNVSYTVKGLAATFFQYGTIILELEKGIIIELENVSTPAVVQETLKNLIEATKNKNY